jgi:hypothetical protein
VDDNCRGHSLRQPRLYPSSDLTGQNKTFARFTSSNVNTALSRAFVALHVREIVTN